MTQKMRQKLRSSYINRFISNRRKLNSKKRLCGDLRLDMLFPTKKKIKYIELAWNEKNLTEAQESHELRKNGKRFYYPPTKFDFSQRSFKSAEIWRSCWEYNKKVMVKFSLQYHYV